MFFDDATSTSRFKVLSHAYEVFIFFELKLKCSVEQYQFYFQKFIRENNIIDFLSKQKMDKKLKI